MVELKISGCCNRCPHIELDMRKADLSFFTDNRYHYSISCIHEKVCGLLEKERSLG